jgi:hypothetical protein
LGFPNPIFQLLSQVGLVQGFKKRLKTSAKLAKSFCKKTKLPPEIQLMLLNQYHHKFKRVKKLLVNYSNQLLFQIQQTMVKLVSKFKRI